MTSEKEQFYIQRIAELEKQVAKLTEQVVKLTDKVAMLSKNSSNSSKPPSSDIVKPRKTEGKTLHNKGAQPGHVKHARTPFCADEIDSFYEHTLDVCPECGGVLELVENATRVVQQVEIVEKPVSIEQHSSLCYWCEHCQKLHYAPLPPQIEKGQLAGPHLTAIVAYMKGATINDLAPQAILKARDEYKRKFPTKITDVDSWDDPTFLNKAKLTRQNKITRAAIILLGKEEAEHFISPSVAKITRILRDASNHNKDYEHFGPPFISNVERVLSNIRNLKYRYLPAETLFPTEINQYDLWVIREALHNCIAHQDYELKGKINVVERPDELIFDNVGSFIPGSVEAVITQDSPPEVYRNHFLASAMFNLNMIDTIGGGIKKMFKTQMERFFPLPDYDLSHPDKVIVKIAGKVLNENYTRLLIKNPDMDLTTVMLLDKVQKGISISKDAHKSLKSQKLVEGRYPRLFVSSSIAAAMGEKAKYIRYRAFDDQQYKNMIIAFIKKYGSASRKDIDDLLLKKLSDVLGKKQKQNKISNLLYAMSKKDLGVLC